MSRQGDECEFREACRLTCVQPDAVHAGLRPGCTPPVKLDVRSRQSTLGTEATIKSAAALAIVAVLFVANAHGAGQTLERWSVSQSPSGPVLSLAGQWPTGCTPDAPVTSVGSGLITVLVPPPVLPPGTLCTASFSPWSVLVPLNGLVDGSYIVRVSSFGFPEASTSPAVLVEFRLFMLQGTASLAQPVPVAGWQTCILCAFTLLGWGWHRLRATA